MLKHFKIYVKSLNYFLKNRLNATHPMLFGWVGQSHLRIKVTALYFNQASAKTKFIIKGKVNKLKGVVEVAWFYTLLVVANGNVM